MHAGDINDKLLTATQAGEVTVVGELEVDVALLGLGAGRVIWNEKVSNLLRCC